MSRNDNSGDSTKRPGNSVDKDDELNVGETVADAIKRQNFSWRHAFVGSSSVFEISNRRRHPVRRGFSYMLGYLSLILRRSLLKFSIDLIHPLYIPPLVQVSVFYRQSNFVSHNLKNETCVGEILM